MTSHWWQRAVIYQVYPRSFQDTTGNGVGDLNGITQRLDYLRWLGIDALWISPVYPSPMADFGYDVSDYTDIHPLFGTLDDMDRLIATAHERDLRVILDFVPNHTSDEHPWFIEARSSRDNPKRDWYIWRDPAPDGGPPNNWVSRFGGGSAWTWDKATGQYYLHMFLDKQPDLNWRNPEVRAAMTDVMRFWLDRGVDGFRVDVAYRVMKDPQLRDNPFNPDWRPGMDPSFRLLDKYTKNTPDNHIFNRWLREVADEYDERVLIGEMNLPIPELVQHYGTPEAPEFHLPFNFRLVFSEWDALNVRYLMRQYEHTLPPHGWPNWVLSNHDQPRFSTRAGLAQARNGMLFLLTARGTPTLYYGEEIAMTNVPIPPDKVQDPWELLTDNLGLGRDPVRTPMQWKADENAGFTTGEPWLPLAADSDQVNVEKQRDDPRSMLQFTRTLLALRRESSALSIGAVTMLDAEPPLLAYQRQHDADRAVIVLNLSDAIQTWALPDDAPPVAISTLMDDGVQIREGVLHLRPDEGVVLRA